MVAYHKRMESGIADIIEMDKKGTDMSRPRR